MAGEKDLISRQLSANLKPEARKKVLDILANPANYVGIPPAQDRLSGQGPEIPFAQEHFFSALVNHPGLPVTVVDSQGLFVMVNPAWQAMTGFNPADVLGKHFSVVLPKEEQLKGRAVHSLYVDGLAKPAALLGEWQTLNKQGDLLMVNASSVQVAGPGGETYIVSFIRDISEKAALETAVLQEREKFRRYLSDIPSAIILFDEEGTFLDIFPGTEHFWVHVRPAEAVGMKMEDVLPSDKCAEFLSVIRQAIAEKGVVHAEYEMKKGRLRRAFSARVVYLGMEDGGHRVLWHATDITRQRELEESLMEREEFLNSLLEASPDVFLLLSEEGEYLEILGTKNHPWVHLQPLRAIGRTMYDMLPREEALRYHEIIREVLATGQPKTYWYSLTKGTQEVHYTGRVVKLRPGVVLWQERDTTETTLAIRNLEKDKNFYQLVMKEAPAPTFAFRPLRNAEGEIQDLILKDVNAMGAELLEVGPEAYLGQAMGEKFPFFRRSGVLDKFIEVLKTGQPAVFQTPHRLSTGEKITLSVWVKPVDQELVFYVAKSLPGAPPWHLDVSPVKSQGAAADAEGSNVTSLQEHKKHEPQSRT